mmetsp:Transcript_38052/g.104699  ORF Transcript_38052/g.104699 Transcript_38052/m.104699 type:complete len:397 (-) Transcript_38052:66-1256(-)
MPCVGAVPPDAKNEDIPLLNSDVGASYEERDETESISSGSERVTRLKEDQESYDDRRDETESVSSGSERATRLKEDREQERERQRKLRDPNEEGKYFDDPLWYGKTTEQIAYATELEKSNGNAASREGEWKKANRYWKNALRGAEKLMDAELEVRLRLNLALGYTRRKKTDKAIGHCDEVFRERLKTAATPALMTKAHFRRGEACMEAGEDAKAIRSLKAALQIEPGNVDARRKLGELRRREQERRERERALYRDTLLREALAGDVNDAGGIARDEDGAAADDAAEDDAGEDDADDGDDLSADGEASCIASEHLRIASSLTDRSASARLSSLISGRDQQCGSSLNCRVGPQEVFLGPTGVHHSTEHQTDRGVPTVWSDARGEAQGDGDCAANKQTP